MRASVSPIRAPFEVAVRDSRTMSTLATRPSSSITNTPGGASRQTAKVQVSAPPAGAENEAPTILAASGTVMPALNGPIPNSSTVHGTGAGREGVLDAAGITAGEFAPIGRAVSAFSRNGCAVSTVVSG